MRNSLSERRPGSSRDAVQSFVYRDWQEGERAPLEALEAEESAGADTEANDSAVREQAQAQTEAARAQADAEARATLWAQARALAEQELRAGLEQQVEAERAALVAAVADFERQRREYFHQIERELVQMVLAIARKVLNREANIDPLLLAGTVKVALEPLAAGTPVELIVPPSLLTRWEELLDRETRLTTPPKLRADAALEPTGCRLQTDAGVTELSWELQMSEIEKGFLDLLQRRNTAWASESAGHA